MSLAHERLQQAGHCGFQLQQMANRAATSRMHHILLLHAIGAKSGEERTQPLMFLKEENEGPWFVFASYGGGPKDPAWFRNVVANPEFEISVGDGESIRRVPVRARVLEERDTTYARQAELFRSSPSTRRKRPGRSFRWWN
ncbi:nitroreductase/quinone reductase family protein [Devosia ginsengisoli]|uniref:nitroreductase/quinone reductase family protein n=1 Tax=Devosia ginsengisoli TaxID=400770 RepID=UPI0026EE8BD4|nr:nitroreductase/quinone reductase family protein [Devosia ginsengisoli]MCR6671547.1 nitroreductase family deazaflavin-dependent oxidoreductase [Devosia ginsengisoli]